MEICTRALSFWTYQTSQEAKYQEMTQKNLEDKLSVFEKQHQRMSREMNVELTGTPSNRSFLIWLHGGKEWTALTYMLSSFYF